MRARGSHQGEVAPADGEVGGEGVVAGGEGLLAQAAEEAALRRGGGGQARREGVVGAHLHVHPEIWEGLSGGDLQNPCVGAWGKAGESFPSATPGQAAGWWPPYPSLRPSMGRGTRPPRSRAEVTLMMLRSLCSQTPAAACPKSSRAGAGSSSSTFLFPTRNSLWNGGSPPAGHTPVGTTPHWGLGGSAFWGCAALTWSGDDGEDEPLCHRLVGEPVVRQHLQEEEEMPRPRGCQIPTPGGAHPSAPCRPLARGRALCTRPGAYLDDVRAHLGGRGAAVEEAGLVGTALGETQPPWEVGVVQEVGMEGDGGGCRVGGHTDTGTQGTCVSSGGTPAPQTLPNRALPVRKLGSWRVLIAFWG